VPHQSCSTNLFLHERSNQMFHFKHRPDIGSLSIFMLSCWTRESEKTDYHSFKLVVQQNCLELS
jgi:hypothetical protein